MSDARISTGFLSFESSKLKRQPPVAGFGWVTMFWILAFSAVTTPRKLFASTDFNLSPITSSTKIVALSPLAADAGPGKSRQRRLLGGVRSPVQAIGVGMLALCLQNGLGLPEACNVVVDFFLGRNFDQLDRTPRPSLRSAPPTNLGAVRSWIRGPDRRKNPSDAASTRSRVD